MAKEGLDQSVYSSLKGSNSTRVTRLSIPEGSGTQYLRTLAPKTIIMVWLVGPESFNIGYLDPLGRWVSQPPILHFPSIQVSLQFGLQVPDPPSCKVSKPTRLAI